MTTVSLANIQHLIQTHTQKEKNFFPCNENTRDLLSVTFMYTSHTAVLTAVIMFMLYSWDDFLL